MNSQENLKVEAPEKTPLLQEIDAALRAETKVEKRAAREMTLFGITVNLPAIFRLVGALSLIGAAGVFLLQGPGAVGHIARYLSFLTLTGLICALGFFCGLWMKDHKSARVLLAIAAVVIPVNFAQLGALLYSAFGIGSVSGVPKYLLWTAESPHLAVFAAILGVALLTPMAMVSFKTLARGYAKILTITTIGTSLFLLIPTRDTHVAALLALVMFAVNFVVEKQYFLKEATLKTFEGRIARSVAVFPLILLMARTVYLYFFGLDEIFFSMTLFISAALLFAVAPDLTRSRDTAERFQIASLAPGSAAWWVLIGGLIDAGLISGPLMIPCTVIPIATGIFTLSAITIGNGNFFRSIGMAILAGGAVVQLASYGGLISASFCIVSSIMLMLYGYSMGQRSLFGAGLLGMVYGLFYYGEYAMRLYTLSPWLSLAVLGLGAVLLGAYLEKNGAQILLRVHSIRARFEKNRTLS